MARGESQVLRLAWMVGRLVAAASLGVALTVTGVPSIAVAASFVVNATNDAVDVNPGDGRCRTAAGTCTLRAAVMETNALGGADTVTLPAGTYTLSIAGAAMDASAGDLNITDALTMTGAGATSTVITATASPVGNCFETFGDRLLRVAGSLKLSKVTLTGGCANQGGALFVRGSATLTSVIIRGNSGDTSGSGVYVASAGSLTMTGGSLANNRLPDFDNGGGALANAGIAKLQGVAVTGNRGGLYGAGGIWNSGTGTLALVGGTVADNLTDGDHFGGGGLLNHGKLTISRTAFLRNQASIANWVGGGAILNFGTLTATNATFDANSAPSGGGAVYNLGTITLKRVTFINNSTRAKGGDSISRGGGGLSNAGKATLQDVIFRNNTVVGESDPSIEIDGGAINHFVWCCPETGILPPTPYLSASKVTLVGNTTKGSGGGLWSDAPFSLVNVTITNNQAATGSGIANKAPAGLGRLGNVTVARNVAAAGGASVDTETSLRLSNTIVARASGSPGSDCAGPIDSAGGNLASDMSCNLTSVDQSGVDPRLASTLAKSNGSYTPVLLLLAASPAVDRGTGPGCPAKDQRNIIRPIDGDGDGRATCDAGAVEYKP
jgi:large repetitive protein